MRVIKILARHIEPFDVLDEGKTVWCTTKVLFDDPKVNYVRAYWGEYNDFTHFEKYKPDDLVNVMRR